MRTLIPSALIAVLAVLALGGCSTTPRLDQQFGHSVRQARAQQTLDPAAGRVRRPVNGVDGQAAGAAYDNYLRSYTNQQEERGDNFTIGVGSRR